MTKHTKGPWNQPRYLIYASHMAKAEYPIHAKNRGLIAKAYREADARLISAAPDLLEALQNLLPGAEAMGWNTDKARNAIAKAVQS